MTGTECEQMALDNEWSLTRTNACHIAVQNEEMGELRDDFRDFKETMVGQINSMGKDLERVTYVQNINIGMWSIIAVSVAGIAIKRIFNK